ncbi:MAG: HIT domain-containing protein [Thermoplasmatota archaeon]
MAEMWLDNAHDPEQLRRMEELKQNGECHFCGNITEKHTAPIIYENLRWFIVANDFPYKGSVHHYLIVSKQHFTKLSDLYVEAQMELFDAIRWLETNLNITGESIFVRSGDMTRTGATLDHLHLHFIVGEKKSDETEWLTITVGYKKKDL